jgi:phosphoribosylanthranilate isomerase
MNPWQAPPQDRVLVKFCGFVREQDVATAVSLGADAIGFVFYAKSSRYIDGQTAADLRRRLPSSVAAVGLFVNESPERIRSIHEQVGLDVLQIHGDETPDDVRSIVNQVPLPWWRAARLQSQTDLTACTQAFPEAQAWLVDSFSPLFGGTGERFDWQLLNGLTSTQRLRLIMSGGLDASNVGQAIEQVRPMAVDVSSGIQGTDPRTKDARKMEAFMQACRAARG